MNHFPVKKSRSWCLKSKERNAAICFSYQSPDRSNVYKNVPRSFWWLDKRFVLHCSFFGLKTECIPRLRKFSISLQKELRRAERLNSLVPSFPLHIIAGVMLFMTLGTTVTKTPSCKFDRFFKLISFEIRIIRIYLLVSFYGLMLCISFNVGALTEENLLFLEAWRAVDRAYVDKTFNGQSWFRYRENALRTEPMNTREETCKFRVLQLR